MLPGAPYFFMSRLGSLGAPALSRLVVNPSPQDHALLVDSAPQITGLAVDLHEHLIQMKTPLRIATHVRDPFLSDLGGEHRAKPVPPKPDGLVADVDTTLGQQILDVA